MSAKTKEVCSFKIPVSEQHKASFEALKGFALTSKGFSVSKVGKLCGGTKCIATWYIGFKNSNITIQLVDSVLSRKKKVIIDGEVLCKSKSFRRSPQDDGIVFIFQTTLPESGIQIEISKDIRKYGNQCYQLHLNNKPYRELRRSSAEVFGSPPPIPPINDGMSNEDSHEIEGETNILRFPAAAYQYKGNCDDEGDDEESVHDSRCDKYGPPIRVSKKKEKEKDNMYSRRKSSGGSTGISSIDCNQVNQPYARSSSTSSTSLVSSPASSASSASPASPASPLFSTHPNSNSRNPTSEEDMIRFDDDSHLHQPANTMYSMYSSMDGATESDTQLLLLDFSASR